MIIDAHTHIGLQRRPPEIEMVSRNRARKLFDVAPPGNLEIRVLAVSNHGDLARSILIREEFARSTTESIRDLEEYGDRRDRLQILDLVDRTRRNTRLVSELLQRQARLISPAADSKRNPL